MQALQAAAPGKLIIVGEYAVLHGGAALSIAAGCRATATLQPAAQSALLISNSGEQFPFTVTDGVIAWHSDPREHGTILAAAVATLHELGSDLTALGPFTIELNSREFYVTADGTETKLGLGSSAAVTVALSGCLQQALADTTTLELALAVHRAHQGGAGSGIDVVTSYRGGCVAFREDGQVTAVDWPSALHMLPVWTGKSALTPGMLATLARYGAEQPQGHRDAIAALVTTAGAARYACEADDIVGFMALLDEYAVRLRELDAAANIGIWSAEHQQLAQLAADAGLIYKPSGAGGGDFGLAFSTDADALNAFAVVCEQAGYRRGDFALGVNGLSISTS